MNGRGWMIIAESPALKNICAEYGWKTKVGNSYNLFVRGDGTMTVRAIDSDGNWYYEAECADDEYTLSSFLAYCQGDVGACALQEKKESGKWEVFFE